MHRATEAMVTHTLPYVSSLLPAHTLENAGESRTHTQRYYRPELDVLRFVAFMLVFTSHMLPANATVHGFHPLLAVEEASGSGVCLFFTLSAFLITELLLREREATGAIHIPAFYVRRILRIWPLYLLFVFAAALLPLVFHQLHSSGSYILPYLLLAGNWANVFHNQFAPSLLLGTLWSISIEEQFYLIWPSLISFWGSRGLTVIACVILPVAWGVDYFIPTLHAAIEPRLWCNSFSQFQFFALGGLLALLMHKRKLNWHPALRWCAVAASACLLLVAAEPFHYLHNQTSALQAYHGHVLAGYLAIDGACLLLLLAFLGAHMPPFTRPLIYLGKISYGLYVFHFPIREVISILVEKKLHTSYDVRWWLVFTISLALSILLAALSYEFFEKPFLRLKKRFTFVPSRIA